MKLKAFYFLFLSQIAFAQKADLLIIDEDINTENITKEFQIHKPSQKKSFLPPLDIRDQFLKNVPESASWDEYRKDAFYMDVKNKSINEINKKYPQYKIEVIKKLKAKI